MYYENPESGQNQNSCLVTFFVTLNVLFGTCCDLLESVIYKIVWAPEKIDSDHLKIIVDMQVACNEK